jgi:hypothetical protein
LSQIVTNGHTINVSSRNDRRATLLGVSRNSLAVNRTLDLPVLNSSIGTLRLAESFGKLLHRETSHNIDPSSLLHADPDLQLMRVQDMELEGLGSGVGIVDFVAVRNGTWPFDSEMNLLHMHLVPVTKADAF